MCSVTIEYNLFNQHRENYMRQEYIDCRARITAKKACPWAVKIVALDYGYMAFESMTDYLVWYNKQLATEPV